jgi:hypothetical protein
MAESRLDGVLLAIRGAVDPPGDATAFLASRNIGDGDRADVRGAKGFLGTEPVLFMTDAQLLPAAPLALSAIAASPIPAARRKAKSKAPAAGRKRRAAAKRKRRAAGPDRTTRGRNRR